MNNKILYILSVLLAVGFSSCLDDPLPQTDGALSSQVEKADKVGLVNGLTQYMNTPYATESSGVYTGIGYPEYVIWHDVMTQDLPIFNTGWNYWQAYSECLYMGNWVWQSYYWWYYNALIYKATMVIKNCNPNNDEDALYMATGYAHRAYVLFEMARMYEYRKTGTSQDASYYEKLKGLTVPIVNENTTEDQAKNNPRAPFYELYRYVLNDLLLADEAIQRTQDVGSLAYASEGMICGLLARFWMELGSRFERYPSDLDLQIQHDNDQYPELGEGYQNLPAIGVKTSAEAFAKAAVYARRAINGGYTPLTKSEWYNKATGFNTATDAWMWAVLISSSDQMCTYYTWESWVSFMSPETEYGIAGPNYQGAFMSDAKLFSEISDKDWRKATWIDPADWLPDNPTEDETDAFKKTFSEKYAAYTNLSYDQWSTYGPYISFKFHPGSGNMTSSASGNKVDIPLMRVEEMYFIEAEALAKTQGIGAGISALESFMNNYRYTDGSYKCKATLMRDFEKEVVRQKRIEFWGEGICLFDYKRMELPIERGYEGSNHPDSYQFNSLDGCVAPWTILYIPPSENHQNPAVLLNPDPSAVMLECKYYN